MPNSLTHLIKFEVATKGLIARQEISALHTGIGYLIQGGMADNERLKTRDAQIDQSVDVRPRAHRSGPHLTDASSR
jgi:hypothetical protein